MSERKSGLFSVLSNRVQSLVTRRQKSEVPTSMAVFVEPYLSVLPSPLEDSDGYDRYWILRGEKDAFYGGNDILRASDLDHEVMEWIRKNYPDSYSTPGIRLHTIKGNWFRDPVQRSNNSDGWKELLKDDRWKELVPPTDFE